MFKPIVVKSALHYHKNKIATNYDLNIYRGCEHKCKYCFAQYSHKYLEADFFDDIFIKTNVAEILDIELSKKSWKGDCINISGVCDCYQPIEKEYKLMPKILTTLIKYKNPTIIITKSPLILRDFDLIKELSNVTDVNILITITTLDEDIRKKIEPNTFSSMERFETIKKLSTIKNCKICTMFTPIIPYLTDDIKNIEGIFKLSKEYNAKHLIAGALNLRGEVKTNFYTFLQKFFPETYKNIQHLYKSGYVSKIYESKLNNFLLKMKRKYNLYSMYFEDKKPITKVVEYKQLDLFEQL